MDIILFCSMNQDQPEYEYKWKIQLQILSSFIKESIQFLQKYCSYISARSPSYRHPNNNYIKAWKLIYEQLNAAVVRFKDNKIQVLLSTILNWTMPDFMTAYNDLYIYIREAVKQSQVQPDSCELSPEQIKMIHQEFKLDTAFRVKVVELESILKIPLAFIERFLERIITFSEAIDLRLGSCESMIEQSLRGEAKLRQKQTELLTIEARQLKQSLTQFNNYLQFLNMDDKGNKQVNRDNSVLRFTIINKQYPQIIKNKLSMSFCYRLKLICRWKKLEKKRAHRLKQRKMKILQLINGEKNYIAGLQEYITCIKNPIIDLDILDQDQRRLLFSSIGQIKDFHVDMLEILEKEYSNYDDQQCYGLILRKYIPFFKLYTDYILNATAAQKFLQDLQKSSKEVGDLCRKYTESTSKIAHNELSQPTFRIARYQMLFESIIKSTNSSHPDRKHLTDVLKFFKTILTQVNNQVDKIIRRNRLNQLQQEYGSIEPIYGQGRQFLEQFTLTLIKEPRPEQVNLIICTDLLLIVDGESDKLMRSIKVNQNFFARREDDNKIYRNMVTIHSDGFTTFTTGPEEVNANRAEEVYQVLKKITKDTGQQVVVQVLGTEEIGSTSFVKYTEYITEVKYLELKKILHMRFSSVSEMVQDMQSHYKDNLKINDEDNLKKSWFNSHKSKVIQARKMIIAQIFMKLFNHPFIKEDPAYFLNYLDLPLNFYEVARSSYEKRIIMSQSVTVSGLKRSYLTRREEKQAFTILCATELQLGKDLFHDNDRSEDIRKTKDSAEKVEIQILTLIQSEPVRIKISQYDTVEDACNKVSTLIGLRSNRDFRLFHEIGKKELRVLDHQQFLTKIFQFSKSQNVIIVGFVETIKSTIQKIVSPKTLPTLIFKKYYYLYYDIQQSQFRRDLTRLRLMTFQIFSQIWDMKYQLTFDEYLLFLAMLIYITIEGNLARKNQVDPNIVHRVIPPTVFKIKNYSEQQWLAKCNHHLQRVHEQIQKVIEYNRGQLQTNKIQADTVSKMALYFGQKHLCSQIVLNKIKTNPIFGSNLFYIQPHSSCYKKLQQQGLKVAYNMWLAIKTDSLSLLTPSSKETIFQLKYTDIERVQVFSEAVVIRKDGPLETEYRLNTYQSFEISQLIKYNKILSRTMQKLKEDRGLNSRVKSYRDQLIQYRTTVEGEGGGVYSMIK